MDPMTAKALATAGAFSALGFAALGSAIGCGVAGMSAVGAWKKCYAQNKPGPFQLVIFAGAPLSQTIYGFILMFIMNRSIDVLANSWPAALMIGILGGSAMGLSAVYQGKGAASACDAFAETGKGFANDIMILGITETIAIFVLVFGIMITGTIK